MSLWVLRRLSKYSSRKVQKALNLPVCKQVRDYRPRNSHFSRSVYSLEKAASKRYRPVSAAYVSSGRLISARSPTKPKYLLSLPHGKPYIFRSSLLLSPRLAFHPSGPPGVELVTFPDCGTGEEMIGFRLHHGERSAVPLGKL